MNARLLRCIVIFVVAALSSMAASAQAESHVAYGEPGTIELVGRGFAEEDLVLLTRRMTRSLLAAPFAKASARGEGSMARIVVGELHNETGEAIDLDALGDRITVALVQSGAYEVIDVAHRKEIAMELEYQRSGYVDPDGAHARGGQVAVDYMLTGSLKSIEQHAQPSSLVDYMLTLQLTELDSGVTRWAEQQGIRKRIELRGISTHTSAMVLTGGVASGVVVGLVGAGTFIYSLTFVRFDEERLEGHGFDAEFVKHPGRGPDPLSALVGAGLMVTGAAIAIATIVLTPPGNPELDVLERSHP